MPVGLIFFAVPEEATPFLKKAARDGHAPRSLPPLLPDTRRWAVGPHEVQVSGMGPRRAAAAADAVLRNAPPQWVITAGFAGGLNPAWQTGDVLSDLDPLFPIAFPTTRSGSFHCADQVAVTSSRKAALHQSVGCDAVEMESGIIRNRCRDRSVPSATIRVISDTATEDLPLDFNALMTADHRMNFTRLAWDLVRSPGRIPALLRFQKQLGIASDRLGETLVSAVFRKVPLHFVPFEIGASRSCG